MGVEEQTEENTKNIAALTTAVAELSTMFKYSEKAREDERGDVKDIVKELQLLNSKMADITGLRKDVDAIGGVMRDQDKRVKTLETWQATVDGASGAVKVGVHIIWAFVSVGGLTFVGWVINKMTAAGIRIGGE